MALDDFGSDFFMCIVQSALVLYLLECSCVVQSALVLFLLVCRCIAQSDHDKDLHAEHEHYGTRVMRATLLTSLVVRSSCGSWLSARSHVAFGCWLLDLGAGQALADP